MRVAELFPAGFGRQRRCAGRQQPGNAPRRSHLFAVRFPLGACFSRWSTAHRTPVLHQLGFVETGSKRGIILTTDARRTWSSKPSSQVTKVTADLTDARGSLIRFVERISLCPLVRIFQRLRGFSPARSSRFPV